MKPVFVLVALLSGVAAAEDWLLQTVQRYEATAARCPATDDVLLWPQDAHKPRAVFRTQRNESVLFEMSWEGLWDFPTCFVVSNEWNLRQVAAFAHCKRVSGVVTMVVQASLLADVASAADHVVIGKWLRHVLKIVVPHAIPLYEARYQFM